MDGLEITAPADDASTEKTDKEGIDQLWCDSVTAEDGVASERLVAVSHAIRRVVHLLDESHAIG